MDIFGLVLWGTVILYAIASLCFISALILKKRVLENLSFLLSIVALVCHVIATAIRWIDVGYGPYIGFFDALSSYALLTSFTYIALVVWRPTLKSIGTIVMPIAFILLAVALTSSPSDMGITPALASVWLVIHVIFAATAVTAVLVSCAIAVIYIMRDKGKEIELFKQLPDQTALDMLVFQFVSVGFILWTIMIIIGAVWANEAWGRYWGWDPIETWSLIAWVMYALCLHMRLTMGWKGRRFAYLALVAVPLMLFALIGVPFVWDSIHAAYLS